MKSSIKIDFIDRGTGVGIEPVIRVEIKPSDDPRDKLIQTLFQSVQGEEFLQFRYYNQKQITTPEGYPDMEKQVLLFKQDKDATDFMVLDNSHGFRKFLDEKGIKWKQAEHYTAIASHGIDLFQLGRDLEKYKAANS